MTDIALLGIKVDSTSAVKAGKDLDALAVKSSKTEKATDALTGSTKRATAGLTQESVVAAKTARATDQLTASTTKATSATSNLTASLRATATAMAAFVAIAAAGKLRDLKDEAIAVDNRLKQVTSSTGELNKAFTDLLKISNDTRTGLSATSVLYQRLTLVSDQLGLSSNEVLKVTSTINKAFAVSGATATETSGAIRQLSQGLAAGALRGDEFNSVAENAPEIMKAIAKELSLTNGELREFAATGGITAEVVISALQGVENEMDTKFSNSVATFGQKMEVMNNNLIEWARNNDDLTITLSAVADVVGIVTTALTAIADIVLMVTSGWIQLIKLGVDFANSFGSVSSAIEAGNRPLGDMIDLNQLLWEGVGRVNKVLLTTVQVISTPFVAAFFAAEKAIAAFVNATINAYQAVATFTGIGAKATKGLDQYRMEVQNVTSRMAKFHKEFDAGRKSIDETTKSIINAGKATETLSDSLGDAETAAMKKRMEDEKQQDVVDALVAAMDEENVALGRTKREQAELTAVILAGLDATDQQIAEIRAANNALYDHADAIEAAKVAAKDMAKISKAAAKEIRKGYEESLDFTSDALQTFFREGHDGFSDWADGVVDLVKDMFAKIVAEAAAADILRFFGIGGGSGGNAGLSALFGGGGGSGGGGGGFNLGSLASTVSSIGTVWTTGTLAVEAFTAALSSGVGVIGSVDAALGAVYAGAEVAATQTVAPLTYQLGNQIGLATAAEGTAAGISGAAAAGWAALVVGIVNTFNDLKDGRYGVSDVLAGRNLGIKYSSALNDILPTFAFGDQLDAAQQLAHGNPYGSLKASLFGGDFKTKDAGVRFGIDNSEIDAQSFQYQKKSGGLIGSTKRRLLLDDLDSETVADLQATVDGYQTVILDAFGTLGKNLSADLFDTFSSEIIQISTAGKSQEQINNAIGVYFDTIGQQMVDHIGRLDGITLDRLLELANTLNFVNSTLESIGAKTLAASKQTAEKSEELIAGFGGAEAFNAATSNFQNLFVEDRSEQEIIADTLGGIFSAINQELPATRDGFTELVQGLELWNTAEQNAFITLTSLSTQIDDYYQRQEALAAANAAELERITANRVQLEIQEMILLGDSAGALAIQRQIELSAMDESLRPIQERIFALQDEATAADNAARASVALAMANQELMRDTDTAFSMLQTSVAAETSRIQADAASSVSATNAQFSGRASAISQQGAANAAGIQARGTADRASIQSSITGTRAALSAVKSLSGSLNAALSSLGGAESSQVGAQAILDQQLVSARAGDFSTSDDFTGALRTIVNQSTDSFSSLAEFTRATSQSAAKIEELKTLTDGQLTLEERTLAALENRAVAAANHTQALLAQNSSNTQALLAQNSADAAMAVASIQNSAAAQIEALNVVVQAAEDEIDVQRGTYEATLSVVEAINNLASVFGAEEAAIPAPSFANGGDHKGGLRLVGERGPELEATGASRIMNSSALASAIIGGGGLSEIMTQVRNEIKSVGFAVAKNTLQTRKLLTRWDQDGLPPERAAV